MKKVFSVILASLMLFCLVSCSSSDKGSMASSGIANIESGSSQSVKGYHNPLSGEDNLSPNAVNKRPVAVMINNIKSCLPHKGIGEADICYEAWAEGGITRILAVFSDIEKVDALGSLRSARNYYISFALSHDAILCHFGGSPHALNYIKDNKIETINFISTNASYRDQDRINKGYGRTNSAFTTGKMLKDAIARKKINTTATIADAYKFGDTTAQMSAGNTAENILVPFSGSTKSTFTYDSSTGLYKKGQFGKDHIDENTGKTLTVKNVFVLNTTIEVINDNYKNDYVDMDLTGGSGYYAANGKVIPITWKKGGYNNAIKYYTADGKELTVAKGKSWVCFVSNNNSTFN